MVNLTKGHIKGLKTYKEVKEEIDSYYNNQKEIKKEEKEADEVSAEIYAILKDQEFEFSITTLQEYHKKLFHNLEKTVYNAGKFRQYNVTKEEEILGGETVFYVPFQKIIETLRYDFSEEKTMNYDKMTNEEVLDRITEFSSRIWQVHPFQEGNTRTTAVFIQKHLMSRGYEVNNEIFKENAKYYRNALVRANYSNRNKGVEEDKSYLRDFYDNLLNHSNHELENNKIKINRGRK